VGSGGTLAGVAEVLQPRGVKVALSDPEGSGLYKLYTGQEAGGNSITEGIGQGRITANLEGFTPDACYKIPDTEALPIVFDLLAEEGLCLGGSSGINVAGAVRMARDMGPGHTIVTILCDYGTRYQSKLFNPEFLAEKGLPIPPWMTGPGATCRKSSRHDARPSLASDRHLPALRRGAGGGTGDATRCGWSATGRRLRRLGSRGRAGREPPVRGHGLHLVFREPPGTLVDWRTRFRAAADADAARIATLEAEIATLGPCPRMARPSPTPSPNGARDLNDRLAQARVPQINAAPPSPAPTG
jgi:hypothetical protein